MQGWFQDCYMCWYSCLVVKYWYLYQLVNHCLRFTAWHEVEASTTVMGPWSLTALGVCAVASSLSLRENFLCLPRPSSPPQCWAPLAPVWVCAEEVRQKETCQGSAPSQANKIHFSKEVLNHLGDQRVFLLPLQLFSSTYRCEVQKPSPWRPVQGWKM